MDRFRKIFKNKYVVLPVIHVEDLKQAVSNVAIAQEVGADGVFLINHRISYLKLLDIYQFASAKFPGFWMGVNCLDLEPFRALEEIFKKGLRVAGVWVDNAQIDELSEDQHEPEKVKRFIRMNKWKGLYFGGVAFKYQPQVSNLEKVARIAEHYMDVVTTSGPATGQTADPEKIRRIRRAIMGKPLAIASGITPENVLDYLNISDCFLVATGISKNFTTLDPKRLNMLIKAVRNAK